jgi:DNA-binding CsgD family transcriptional regulator
VVALTARELDTARLVAEGNTNKQIAEHHGITKGTARNNLSRVRRKLGIPRMKNSRVQVATWYIKQKKEWRV